jgi:hypothetical protein
MDPQVWSHARFQPELMLPALTGPLTATTGHDEEVEPPAGIMDNSHRRGKGEYVSTAVDTNSPMVRATLALRLALEGGLLAGIVVASIAIYDAGTAWLASTVGIATAAGLWGVFAVPNDPSRSGRTVVNTPGALRLLLEIALFAMVTAWLALGDSHIFAILLGSGALVHYASWPARIRWLLQN